MYNSHNSKGEERNGNRKGSVLPSRLIEKKEIMSDTEPLPTAEEDAQNSESAKVGEEPASQTETAEKSESETEVVEEPRRESADSEAQTIVKEEVIADEKAQQEVNKEEGDESKVPDQAELDVNAQDVDASDLVKLEDKPVTGDFLAEKNENVDYDLIDKQTEYLMESEMLSKPEFQQLSKEGKVTAIVDLLSSNPDTQFPQDIIDKSSLNLPVSTSAPTSSLQQKAQLPQSTVPRAQASEINRRGLPPRPDLTMPMSPEEQQRYAEYLRGENKITEMHNIPPKSRLFIGNLPLKNVSKEDLFRIFSIYGHILQINIKNAFGFIQYDNPRSVLNAVEMESNEINFGKKLILEVSSSNSRPQFDHGDHGTNSSSTFISSSKRPFQTDEGDIDPYGYKKNKRRVPACIIYVKRTADRTYANDVFNQFRRGTGLETDMIFLKPRMELRRLINDAAFDGVWGVILVNKTHNVDIQTFYKGPQGETKFDEYISVSINDSVSIFNNLKTSRNGSMQPQPPMAGSPYGAMAPPPPQQGYYGGYGMPPQQQMPPMHQQPYGQQPYSMASTQAYGIPAGGPAPPQQMPPTYGRYQNSPPAPVAQPPMGSQNAQLSSILGGNNGAAGGQMNQQQLLAAIQNLPPNVVSNLLSMAQQQQQQPNGQQQLLNMIQTMGNQQQQQPQGMGQMGVPDMNSNYAQPPPSHQQQQPQQQQQPSAGSNVQSLLNSLAKLQK